MSRSWNPIRRRREARAAARERMGLGTYEPPQDQGPPPVDRVLEDALLVASAGVRMSLKNAIIVRSLRDGDDFDRSELLRQARDEFITLAQENQQSADRIDQKRGADREGARVPRGVWPGGKPSVEDEDHRRRPQMHRLLAITFRTAADDHERLASIVDAARDLAVAEITAAASDRVVALNSADEPGYRRDHGYRVHLLIDDLDRLRAQRNRDRANRDGGTDSGE